MGADLRDDAPEQVVAGDVAGAVVDRLQPDDVDEGDDQRLRGPAAAGEVALELGEAGRARARAGQLVGGRERHPPREGLAVGGGQLPVARRLLAIERRQPAIAGRERAVLRGLGAVACRELALLLGAHDDLGSGDRPRADGRAGGRLAPAELSIADLGRLVAGDGRPVAGLRHRVTHPCRDRQLVRFRVELGGFLAVGGGLSGGHRVSFLGLTNDGVKSAGRAVPATV